MLCKTQKTAWEAAALPLSYTREIKGLGDFA